MGRIKAKAARRIIGSAEPEELVEIVKAVRNRYGELFSEEEVVFLSLPKHDMKERQRIIHAILEIEQCRE